MGAQQLVVGEIEGVLHVPRRVVRGNVQGGEVVVIAFDLRPFLHPVTEARENIHDFLDRADQRMAMARGGKPGRHGHVQRFAGDALGHGRGLHRRKPLAQQCLGLLLEHIRPLPYQRSFIPWQLAHGSQHRGELALLAQESNA